MDWLSDNSWLAWLGLAIALAAIEVVTVDFVFLMLAGGALGGAAAAALGMDTWVQVVTAIVVASVLLVGVRPLVKKRFMVEDGNPMGAAANVGRSAIVLQTVTSNDGRIKLSGDVWSARTTPGAAVCLPGQEVRVLRIEGATAIVGTAEEARREVTDR